MGCVNFLTDEHDKLLAASYGKTCEIDPEILEKMPEVKRALAEDAERRLAFEDNQEKRDILKEDLPLDDRQSIDEERKNQEVIKFNTAHGDFAIRQSLNSHLSLKEIKNIYREETPHCVIERMWGVATVDKVKEKIAKDGKIDVTLGEHGVFKKDDRGINLIYKHPEEILAKSQDPSLRAIWQSGNQEKIKQALAQIERGTHHHEIGEAIYEKNFTVEEIEDCAKLYEEGVKEGWMEDICNHSDPSSQQFACDAYKMFQMDPQRLKSINEQTFKFIQNKVISLETKDVFTSLEDRENDEEEYYE